MTNQNPTAWDPSQTGSVSFSRLLAQMVGELKELPTRPPVPDDRIVYGHQVNPQHDAGTDDTSAKIRDILHTRFGWYSQLPLRQVSATIARQTEPVIPQNWPVPPAYSLTHPDRETPAFDITKRTATDPDSVPGTNTPPQTPTPPTGEDSLAPSDAGSAMLYGITSRHQSVTEITVDAPTQVSAWYAELLHTASGTLYVHGIYLTEDNEPRPIFTGRVSESTPLVWFEIGRQRTDNTTTH